MQDNTENNECKPKSEFESKEFMLKVKFSTIIIFVNLIPNIIFHDEIDDICHSPNFVNNSSSILCTMNNINNVYSYFTIALLGNCIFFLSLALQGEIGRQVFGRVFMSVLVISLVNICFGSINKYISLITELCAMIVGFMFMLTTIKILVTKKNYKSVEDIQYHEIA